jgi:hypothetical protein
VNDFEKTSHLKDHGGNEPFLHRGNQPVARVLHAVLTGQRVYPMILQLRKLSRYRGATCYPMKYPGNYSVRERLREVCQSPKGILPFSKCNKSCKDGVDVLRSACLGGSTYHTSSENGKTALSRLLHIHNWSR